MSRGRVAFASLGLTGCICWSIVGLLTATTIAEPSDGSVSAPVVAERVDINDPVYLQSIGLMRDARDAGVPVIPAAAIARPIPTRVEKVHPLPPNYVMTAPGGGDPRGDCSIVYSNFEGGSSVWVMDGSNILAGDDTTMATNTTNRFVCSVSVGVATIGTFNSTYLLRCQLWAPYASFSTCPDNGSVMIAEDVHLQVSPNSSLEEFNFSNVLIPNTIMVGLKTPAVTDQTGGSGPSWVITSGYTGNDIGSSDDDFYVGENLNGNCADDMAFFGGNPLANFAIEIKAGPGDAGSCCNQSTGVCTEPVFLGDCNAFQRRFSLLACPQTPQFLACAICDKNCIGATVTENEPTCGLNYSDTTNNGCSTNPGTENFISVTCGADICGKYGNYNFMNGTITEHRRDNDYYRIVLGSTQRVTFSVDGEAPSEASILIPAGPGNGCEDLFISLGAGDTSVASSSAGCSAAVATTCLPPGTYYLRARTVALEGIPCGTDYRATVACVACTLPTGACCLPTLPSGSCVTTTAIQCQRQGGVYRGDNVLCGAANCPIPPSNETCSTKSTVPAITTNTTLTIDTSFALTDDTTVVSGCETTPDTAIFQDVWYDYRLVAANQPAGVSNGRIAVSTYESCFDTKVAVYRVFNCNATQASQCASMELVGCNDDMNAPRQNVASYVEINSNGDPEDPVSPAIGECYKIRLGGAVDDGRGAGAGFLREDFLPSLPAPWSGTSGRCCFPNGTCQIRPSDGSCQTAGGYLTSTIELGEGDINVAQISSVGCHTIPCPVAGEACFNALDLNAILGGGGFGTTTRAILNKLYYKYQIPFGAQPGSGLTISTCGSSFNTAIAVYSDFDHDTGSCTGQPIIVQNDNCSPSESSGATAQGIASCFAPTEQDSCTCITVGTLGQATGPGSTIYIEIGASNAIAGSTLPNIDPVPQNCATPVTASLTITASAQCFACTINCPGGSTQENEPDCSNNNADTTNGCAASGQYTNITCGQTICGTSGTFIFANGTAIENHRDTDFYRFTLTTAKHVVVSTTAAFPSEMVMYQQAEAGDICDPNVGVFQVADVIAPAGCLLSTLDADLCAGTFLVGVFPTSFTGINCGSDYTMSFACQAPHLANCCKGDMNNDGKVNGIDIRLFVDFILHPTILPAFPVTGCYNLNTCHADFNNDSLVTVEDISIPGPSNDFVDALLGTNVCPTLPACSDPARCHLPDQSGGSVSDLNTASGCNKRCADDFKVDVAGNVSSMCWYGFYLNVSGSTACTPQTGSSADNFRVTIYNDNAGVPGTVKAGPFSGLAITKTATGATLDIANVGVVNEYKYETTITSTALTVNTCYWLEVVNGSTGACCWAWESGSFTNGVSAVRSGGPAGTPNYVASNITDGDLAFCLNDIRINKRDCGLPQGRCCINQGVSCQTTDVFTCQNALGGLWTAGISCLTNPCPINDECTSPVTIGCGQSLIVTMPTDGFTANPTDPDSTCEIAVGGPFAKDFSWWYKFTPNVSGTATISMCSTNPGYDTVVTVFNANQTCANKTEKACNDDGCVVAGDPFTASRIQNMPIVAGASYLILVDHYSGLPENGNYTITITCP